MSLLPLHALQNVFHGYDPEEVEVDKESLGVVVPCMA